MNNAETARLLMKDHIECLPATKAIIEMQITAALDAKDSAAADEVGRLRAELKTANDTIASSALALHDAIAECRVLAREVAAWRERERTRVETMCDIRDGAKHAAAIDANEQLNEARTATDASGAMKHKEKNDE